jgi:CrcB protein
LLAVAIGAGIGGVLRLLVTQLTVNRFGVSAAIYATMFINVGGSFLIGVVIETAQLRTGFNPLWRYFLATGVLGGYTTFSTFSYESVSLFSSAMTATGYAYIAGSVGLGIGAALLGIATAKVLVPH